MLRPPYSRQVRTSAGRLDCTNSSTPGFGVLLKHQSQASSQCCRAVLTQFLWWYTKPLKNSKYEMLNWRKIRSAWLRSWHYFTRQVTENWLDSGLQNTMVVPPNSQLVPWLFLASSVGHPHIRKELNLKLLCWVVKYWLHIRILTYNTLLPYWPVQTMRSSDQQLFKIPYINTKLDQQGI